MQTNTYETIAILGTQLLHTDKTTRTPTTACASVFLNNHIAIYPLGHSNQIELCSHIGLSISITVHLGDVQGLGLGTYGSIGRKADFNSSRGIEYNGGCNVSMHLF